MFLKTFERKKHAWIHFDRKHIVLKKLILEQQNAKRVMDASIWVKFFSKNTNMLEIEHSLLNSPIITHRYGFHLRSTGFADKPHLGSICKQTTIFFISGKFIDSVVNLPYST